MKSRCEVNKKAGVHYAWTADGLELPVIDVAHPAFGLSLSSAEQRSLVDKFLHEPVPLGGLPKAIRIPVLRFLLRGSVLAHGIQGAQGSFMTGMNTYFLKLGPEMLGSAYSRPVDRKIAGALPVLSVRLRLQDMAYLMADILSPALSADARRPLRFVNIAGGPAIDALNALILLGKNQPGLLAERHTYIDVLDLDETGPAFGQAALKSLSEPGGPLHGTRINLRHVPYDWSRTGELQNLLAKARADRELVICSSEGGLFEYGTDDAIEANLKVLRTGTLAVVGSVTRADEPMQRLRKTSIPATRPRGLEVFRNLVDKAGWRVLRAIERPFSDQVALVAAGHN